jgi:uncharacterized protein
VAKWRVVKAGSDPLVRSLTELIQSGDTAGLSSFLHDHPSLPADRFGDHTQSRTALHLATDWPGHYPRVGDTIALLVSAGAPVDGCFFGPHTETPLHWAASSNDLDAIRALLDAGANIEAPGAVLTNGTPLSDAVVFAQWDAARLLVSCGAAMTIWQAAALGELVELDRHLTGRSLENAEITNACWHACRAGQLLAVEQLVGHGADLDWLGYDQLTCRQAGLNSANSELVAWLATQPHRRS